jgi:hypothetical protein
MPGLTNNRAAAPEDKSGDISMEDAPTSAQISGEGSQNTGDAIQKDGAEEDDGEEEEEEEEAEVQRVRIVRHRRPQRSRFINDG